MEIFRGDQIRLDRNAHWAVKWKTQRILTSSDAKSMTEGLLISCDGQGERTLSDLHRNSKYFKGMEERSGSHKCGSTVLGSAY